MYKQCVGWVILWESSLKLNLFKTGNAQTKTQVYFFSQFCV